MSLLRGLFFCVASTIASTSVAVAPLVSPSVVPNWEGAGRKEFLAEMSAVAEQRVWVVGEVHGTNEAQALALDLVVSRLPAGPVILALEMPQRSQPSVDAYMASDGSQAAVGALLSEGFWAGGSDGRNTLSMLRLIEAVRTLRAGGATLQVLCFDPAEGGAAARDAGMAKHINAAMTAHPKALFVVLVGNAHSQPTGTEEAGKGATNLVSGLRAPAFVVNLATARGSFWACMRDGCGPHQVKNVAHWQSLLDAQYSPIEGRGQHTFKRLSVPQFTPSFPAIEALGLAKQ